MKRVQSNTTLPDKLKEVAQMYCESEGKTLTGLQQWLLEEYLRSKNVDPYPKTYPTARMGCALVGAMM